MNIKNSSNSQNTAEDETNLFDAKEQTKTAEEGVNPETKAVYPEENNVTKEEARQTGSSGSEEKDITD